MNEQEMSRNSAFYNQGSQEVLKNLSVDPQVGLDPQEVKSRQIKFGLNELPKPPKISPLKLFFSQFQDVLIIVLIIAATVSLGLSFIEENGSFTEPILIYSIVVAIAVIGFMNEYKAEKTIEALNALVGQNCRVRRGSQTVEIPTSQLVPGDILLIEEGLKVPADIRLISINRLQVNEASLTGESLPVNKNVDVLTGKLALGDQKNILFSGTLVTTGKAEGVVVATGAKTEIGKIARLVGSVDTSPTPMQKKLDALGKRLGLIILAICAVVFVVILLFDRDINNLGLIQKLLVAFTAAVALAVAAIPEGLAFVVRISLAIGARRMASKKALVRKLSAVESLGSTDVICSDKTGTLTKGEMTVRELYAGGKNFELSGTGYSIEGELQNAGSKVSASDELNKLLELGVLCNNAKLGDHQILGDPTEGSLIVSAAKLGHKHDELEVRNPRIDELPFTSERKMMTTVHKNGDKFLLAIKGAPDILVNKCNRILIAGKVKPLTPEIAKQILEVNKQMSAKALRVLGFAYEDANVQPAKLESAEKDLIFVGLQGMMDPPRVEVKDVIQRVQAEAGMRVIMITGDNIDTAKAVAHEIGITGDAMTGQEIEELSDEQFAEVVEKVGIYARVNPEHKIKIVQALQKHGHQVAMTGDGVNDAPAIKAADIGIAMGITGTDVSKESADIILLDDQFLTIIKAIEEGRGIYDNVRKFVVFLLSCNIGEVLVVFFGILLHGNLLLTAAQLLFINIVTDGLPAVALGSDPVSKDVMKFKPAHYQQPILTARFWAEIFAFGLLMSGVLLAQYMMNVDTRGAMVASSIVFMAMAVYEFVRLFDIRSDFHIHWYSNPLIIISVVVSLLIQAAVIYFEPLAKIFQVGPIGLEDWLFIGLGSVGLFVVMKLLNPVMEMFGPENPLPPPLPAAPQK